MSEDITLKKLVSNSWLWFIRTSVALAWYFAWNGFQSLITLDKNQALITIQLNALTERTSKIETTMDTNHKEEILILRERLRKRMETPP